MLLVHLPHLVLVAQHTRPHVYFATRRQTLPRVQTVSTVAPDVLRGLVVGPTLSLVAMLARPHPDLSAIHTFARIQADAIMALDLSTMFVEIPMLVFV